MAKATRKTDQASSYDGFTEDERAAMKQRAAELKAAKKAGTAAEKAAAAEAAVVEKIAELPDGDRQLAEQVHALVKAAAPELAPKLWYGMPAYTKDGKNLCFFQPASKFDARYATFGFEGTAQLDDGTMWPTAYAITELTEAAAERLTALIKQAAGEAS
ncbi:iron chaperone [Microlunatus sp. GCM10028923]|uniref:iron chaperone n=1 Tax=Microlunatus sp. GCM10028923 TaxID=3273400 RepID=UPI00360EAE88